MKAEKITQLTANDKIFESTGATVLKVTHRGEVRLIELPIKSIGVADLIDDLADSMPKPPVKRKYVKARSEDGILIGLTKDQFVQMYDATDEDYQANLRQYNDDYRYRLVCMALDVALIGADGAPIVDFEQKKDFLKASGITGHHLDQIMADVQALTKNAEEDADFLSGNGSE